MTTTLSEQTFAEKQFSAAFDKMKDVLSGIEEKVVTGYTLADAIREGSSVSTQAYAWGAGEKACALSAANIAATARGYGA